MFDPYACSFLKENGKGVDLGKGGGVVGMLGGEEVKLWPECNI